MANPLLDQTLYWTAGTTATAQNDKAYFPDSLRGQYIEFIVYIEFSTGAAAGKVQIQTAHTRDYTGTWANVGSTIDFSAETKTAYAAVTGVFGALRLNVDTAVTSGTVTAKVVAAANP